MNLVAGKLLVVKPKQKFLVHEERIPKWSRLTVAVVLEPRS